MRLVFVLFFFFEVTTAFSQVSIEQDTVYAFFHKALAKDSTNSELHLLFGLFYLQNKEYEKSIVSTNKSLEYLNLLKEKVAFKYEKYDSTFILTTRIVCYAALKQYDNKIRDLYMLQSMNPSTSKYINGVIRTCFQKQDTLKAEFLIDSILQLQPKDDITLVTKARLRYEQGKFTEANKLISRIIKLFPNSIEPNLIKAKILYRKKSKKACSYLQKVEQLNTFENRDNERGYFVDFSEEIKQCKLEMCGDLK